MLTGLQKAVSRFFSKLPEHSLLGMPLLSPTMTTGSIVKWLKKEGEVVKPGQILFEVQTDKATLGFQVQDETVLAKILQQEGATNLEVGHPVAILVEQPQDVGAFADYKHGAKEEKKEKTEQKKEEKNEVKKGSAKRVSPSAQTIIEKYGLDVSQILASGLRGTLLKSDVLQFMKSPSVPKQQEKKQVAETPKIPIVGEKVERPPRFTVSVQCNVEQGLSLFSENLQPFVLKCAAQTCMEIPESNGTFFKDFSRLYQFVDIQVNKGGQKFFLTDVHSKTLSKINKELVPSQQKFRTFTINFQEVDSVETPTTSCSLSVGPIFRKAVFLGAQLVERETFRVSLNCDHRIVDGARGAEWLQKFKSYVENPISLLQQEIDFEQFFFNRNMDFVIDKESLKIDLKILGVNNEIYLVSLYYLECKILICVELQILL